MSTYKFILIAFIAGMFLVGCQTLNSISIQGPGHNPAPQKKYKKHGPPPHAPAHGYRHKHRDGHDMEYDSKIGVYVVIDMPETYFGNDNYIRISSDGEWMVSTTLEGGWRVALGNEIPPKLREYKRGKYKKKKYKKYKKKKKNKKYYYDDDQGEDYD